MNCSSFFSNNIDSLKSALSKQVLQGTVTEWPLRSLTGILLTRTNERDSDSSDTAEVCLILGFFFFFFFLKLETRTDFTYIYSSIVQKHCKQVIM